jgi:CRISPR-associated exonuclease Cas4
MQTTGTHIAYLHTCHRKLWLFANGISMEHTSEAVAEGKLIGETTYTDRARKFTQIEIDGVKIDFYDVHNKVVHEVKKSGRMEKAHVAQVQYYLYKLMQKGIEGATGILEYPKLKQRQEVPALTADHANEIKVWEQQVADIISSPSCPGVIKNRICKRCSYEDFCYSGETEHG